jgi:hypothetical protein
MKVAMKRMTWGLLLFLAGAAVFAQDAAEPQAVEPQAVIRELSGTVEVKASNAAAWSPASRGQTITRDTLVSTGFKSSALIAIGNSTLTVQPLTRLSLEELTLAGGSEKVSLSLRTGRVRANVKPPAEGKTDFTVRSPSATASVRGTVFEFNGIDLRVDEGRVHFTGNDRSGTYVGAGHQARTDTETGRVASAGETAKEELTPYVPAGVEIVPGTPAALPSSGDIDAGFEWL